MHNSILCNHFITMTIDKYTRKYKFLREDIKQDLQVIALVEAEKLTDRATTRDIKKICTIIKYRAYDLANDFKIATTQLHLGIANTVDTTRNTYYLYADAFKAAFENLTVKEQLFCKNFVKGVKVHKKTKHQYLKSIRRKMSHVGNLNKKYEVQKMGNDLRIMLDTIEDTDSAVSFVETTMHDLAGDWSLYDYMDLELRKELILYIRGNTTVISNKALVEYIAGIYAYLKKEGI